MVAEQPARARKTPCASCPYRKSVPSGVWHEEEYAKLPAYDLPTWGQPPNLFMCHQEDGHLCSGWLACHGPYELLAIRLGISRGAVDPSVIDYTTNVPLFESGHDAALHGVREILTPDEAAKSTIKKISRKRDLEP